MKIYHTVFFFKVLTTMIIKPKITLSWMKFSRLLQLS
jgi:hypothetical protein